MAINTTSPWDYPAEFRDLLEAQAPETGPSASTRYQLGRFGADMGSVWNRTRGQIAGAGQYAQQSKAMAGGLTAQDTKAINRQVGNTQSMVGQQLRGAESVGKQSILGAGEQQKQSIYQQLYDEGMKAWAARQMSHRIEYNAAKDDSGILPF